MLNTYINKIRNGEPERINRVAIVLAVITTIGVVVLWLVLISFLPQDDSNESTDQETSSLVDDIELLINESENQISQINEAQAPQRALPEEAINAQEVDSENQENQENQAPIMNTQ